MFAYTASAFCDKNGFIVETYLAPGNIHDSISFKGLYDNYKENFGLRFTRYKGAKRVLQGSLLLFSCMNLNKLALRKRKK